MADFTRNFFYKAFGFTILSEIYLPELSRIHTDKGNNVVDIEIKKAKGYKVMDSLSYKFDVKKDQVIFHAPKTATFTIVGGKKITVSPLENADNGLIKLYILGTCMGALLFQRGVLPLHGSAVVIDKKAYAFIGQSGAGKSTIASAFIQKGYRLLSDDIVAVSFENGDDFPYVTPSYPQQKLWQESLIEFGQNTEHYKPLFERETKYAVPVINGYYPDPLPLGGVFELEKSKDDQIRITPVQGLERLQTLYLHTFRQFLLTGLGLQEWHFKTTASLLNHTDMYQLQRPRTAFTPDELATLVIETIKKEETNCDRNKKSFVER